MIHTGVDACVYYQQEYNVAFMHLSGVSCSLQKLSEMYIQDAILNKVASVSP